jgi:hypothetical protein
VVNTVPGPWQVTHHVKIGQGTKSGPVDCSSLDALDPEVVGEEHAEDGDPLVVVGAGHRPVVKGLKFFILRCHDPRHNGLNCDSQHE